jgi:hypothetical protein
METTIIAKMTGLEAARMFERKIENMTSKINAMSALGDARAAKCAARAAVQISRIEKFYEKKGSRATTPDERAILINLLEDIQMCYNNIVVIWNSYSC